MKHFYIQFIFICLFSQFVNAESYNFERISVEHGLSSSSITCILKDSKGYLWVGTNNGLNRYDGYTFKTFKNKPSDSSTINNNYIITIYEDKSQNIWVGTRGGGLNKYNAVYETFKRFDNEFFNNQTSNTNKIWSITEYKENKLILVMDGYIGIFDTEEESITALVLKNVNFKNWGPKSITMIDQEKAVLGTWDNGAAIINIKDQLLIEHFNKNNVLKSNSISAVAKDKNGIWLGVWNGGLYFYNTLTNKLINFNTQNSDISDDKINYINIDNNDILWIGTENGMNKVKFNIEDETINVETFYNEFKDITTLSNNRITYIYNDLSGILWIGTEAGLNKYVSNKNRFVFFRNNPSDPKSLSNNNIVQIYENNKDAIFLGTWGGGMNKLNIKEKNFTVFKNDPNNKNSIAGNTVSSIIPDDNGNLFIGTRNNGISVFNLEKQTFTPFMPNLYKNLDFRINSLNIDFLQRLWINTRTGIYYYDLKNKPDSLVQISNVNNNLLHIDQSGNIWLGTEYSGVIFIDKKTLERKSISKMFQETSEINVGFTNLIFETKEGDIWLALNSLGSIRVNMKKEEVQTYNFAINSIIQSPNGNIWLGTNEGLKKFDKSGEEITSYTKADGLPDDEIFVVIQDYAKDIWLCTNYGISRFNEISEEFKNFDASDGLQEFSFENGKGMLTSEGYILFTSKNGLVLFHPEDIVFNEHVPNAVITNFKLFNNYINAGDKVRNKVILNQSITETSEITLTHRDYIFTLEFASLDFWAPRKNQFTYMLKGFDEEWITTSKNSVTYTNLDPGTYQFLLRSSNNDGKWNNEVTVLKITILPPFYKTWWFRSLVVFLILLVSTFIFYFKINTVKRQNDRLNKQVRERTYELLLQKEELKKINSAKDKLFTIISRDIQNPFTDIHNSTEDMILHFENLSDDKKREQLNQILISSHQAQGLLENLVHWSKANTDKIDFKPEKLKVDEIIHEIIKFYRIQAKNKNIQLYAEHKEVDAFADKEMLVTIFKNIIYNAIKYTPKGGDVKIEFNQQKEFLEVIITDKGIGMTPETLSKIFKLDFHLNTPGTEGEKGTGLGLIICKELINKNKGEIIVESEINKGSVFIVKMPTDFA